MSRFSIILPVKNGGIYIKECVNSILSQSLHDFNLIVLDNCSTDGTAEWLGSIKDPRVLVFPADKPLTIEENWARIKTVEKNEFITLIGHDDLLLPDYLSVINNLIDTYPDASLYQTHFNYIDTTGKFIRKCKEVDTIETPEEFLKKCLKQNNDIMGTGFMMRAKDYDAVGGIPPYPNLLYADFELWQKLTALSYKASSDKVCFSFRLHNSTTTTSSDIKMHQAFEKFISFLEQLKNRSPLLKQVIIEHANGFIMHSCKGLSHRLLRTPEARRNGLSVSGFIGKCKGYAGILAPGNSFRPEKVFSIRLAKIIDSTSFGRKAFLLFKKVFPKPVLK